jgi:hypothetical protein
MEGHENHGDERQDESGLPAQVKTNQSSSHDELPGGWGPFLLVGLDWPEYLVQNP